MSSGDTHSTFDSDYVAHVERHFGLRRGGQVFLSPRDWEQAHDWERQGVPIEVVLRGINRAFDLFAAARSGVEQINSLRYCRQHVEAAWQEHRERLSTEGADRDDGTLSAAAEHFRLASDSCLSAAGGLPDEATAAQLREAADRLVELAQAASSGELGVRQLDAAANRLEARLEQHLAGTAVRIPRLSPWA